MLFCIIPTRMIKGPIGPSSWIMNDLDVGEATVQSIILLVLKGISGWRVGKMNNMLRVSQCSETRKLLAWGLLELKSVQGVTECIKYFLLHIGHLLFIMNSLECHRNTANGMIQK